MTPDCKAIIQNVSNLERNKSDLQKLLKTPGNKASIIEQINDINS